MCVSTGTIPGTTSSSIDVVSLSSTTPMIPAHSSWNLFSAKKPSAPREKTHDLLERANISLHATSRGKNKRKPLLTFDAVTQAFVVCPKWQELVSRNSHIKLEGTYGDGDMCADVRRREGWMLLMPDLEGVHSVSGEMLKWLVGEYTTLWFSRFTHRYNSIPSHSRRIRTIWAPYDVLMGFQGFSLDDVCLPYWPRETGTSQGYNLRLSP